MKISKRGMALLLTAVLAVTTIISPVESNAATAQTVTVDVSTTHQSIRGFGGINHPEWTGLDLTNAQRKKAFENGEAKLGLTVLRVFVNPDSSQWSKAVPTAKYAYENGVDLYSISVQNEPDYASEWTYWSTDETTTFIAEYGDKITSTRLMSPESFQYAPLNASWVSDGGLCT